MPLRGAVSGWVARGERVSKVHLALDEVTALLRAAGQAGLVAIRGDGGPTVDLFIKDGALCLGLKGRVNGGRRNAGDVDGGALEVSVAVPPGKDGPVIALNHVRAVVQALRVEKAR